jgi:hypothetical protein
MTEINSSNREYIFHDGINSVGPIMLGLFKIVAVLLVALVVTANWPSYLLISKFLAAILLADLLFSSTLDRWRTGRTGKRLENSVIELTGYRRLILMALLFLPMLRAH